MAEEKEENVKLFDRIGDHYNNSEMADRILVVKVRKQGWEKLRAAKLARTISQSKSSSTQTEKDDAEKEEEEKRPQCSESESTCVEVATVVPPGSLVEVSNVETSCEKEPEPVAAFAQVEMELAQMSEGDKKTKCGTKRKKIKNRSESLTIPNEAYTIAFDITEKSSGGQHSECKISDVDIGIEDETIKPKAECCVNASCTDNPDKDVKPEQSESEITEELLEVESNSNLEMDNNGQTTVVREYEIYVHSFWLALNSSYFRSLFFSSGMKETRDKQVTINVSEDMSAMFMILIESLYRPDVVTSRTVDELLILMRLSHIYDADTTLKSCQRILSTAELSIPICDKALNMEEHERLVEMDEFIKRCEQFLVEAFSPLDYQWTREEFFSLSPYALKSVLGSKQLCVSSENTVFLALIRWAEINEVYEDALEPLLDLVCFKGMTINYLHDVVTSIHPIASTVPKFPRLFEEAVFFHAFSKDRRDEEGEYEPRKAFEEPILFNWHVENYEDTEFEKKKKIVKSPHFWVSGYEMFLELKLRSSGYQGLYLTICTQQFNHPDSKGFVKLKYSLSSNFLKATHVFNEVDVFDKEGSGWGYEEFFPLTWPEFRDQLKRSPLIITAQVRLLE